MMAKRSDAWAARIPHEIGAFVVEGVKGRRGRGDFQTSYGACQPTTGPVVRAALGLMLLLAMSVAPGESWSLEEHWPVLERVSVRWERAQPNADLLEPALSSNGRYIAFASDATNLVEGDTNLYTDIFVFDRHTGAIERVSVAADGTQANGRSRRPAISSDGRYVAFYSVARNLVAGGFGGSDVFVRDRVTGKTRWVSFAPGMTESNLAADSPAISADGRIVAFQATSNNLVASDTNEHVDIFVHDRDSNEIRRVSVASSGAQANGSSFQPSVSADGRYVAFASVASNLAAEDTNEHADIFVHDRFSGRTERVSVAHDGAQANFAVHAPSLSGDGRHVAFRSGATNLVADDSNGKIDVFVRDRGAGTTTRVSVASDGAEGDGHAFGAAGPALSADGRYVAFVSEAANLVPGDGNAQPDIFVHDRKAAHTERVSVANNGAEADLGSGFPLLSADGRIVAFASAATTLVANDSNGTTDVFAYDRASRSIARAGRCVATEANAASRGGALSNDSRFVMFNSLATNLVEGDTNGHSDAFVYDRRTGAVERASVAYDGAQANGPSSGAGMTPDGRYVVFESTATNLVQGDGNLRSDVFVRDRFARTTTRVSVASNGGEGNGDSAYPSLSGDGRYVAFGSNASNLAPNDTNRESDIFVHDRRTGRTYRIASGSEPNGYSLFPKLSEDGRYVVFASYASNLVAKDTNGTSDTFIFDQVTGTVERVSDQAFGGMQPESYGGMLSADNRFVAFLTKTDGHYLPNKAIIYDRVGQAVRASLAGEPPLHATALGVVISPDARFAAVASTNENFIPDSYWDTGFAVINLVTQQRVLIAKSGNAGGLSHSGNYLVFDSPQADFVPHDTNQTSDVFVAQRSPGADEYGSGPKCGM